MLAAFWAGIPVEVTQEAGVVPRLWTHYNQDTLLVASHTSRRDTMGVFYLPPTEDLYIWMNIFDVTSVHF